MKQDLLSFASWETSQVTALIELALEIKNTPEKYQSVLAGKSIVGVFEKPSLRTRVSFDIGINKLGGHFVYLDSKANHLEGREAVADTAANLGCWADAIVGRVFKHSTLEGFTAACDIPVINALCDLYHPCQGLADFLTMTETFGDVSQTKLAYIGDGNNVTHSLLIVGAHLGAEVVVITPESFEVDQSIFEQAQLIAKGTGAKLSYSNHLNDAKGSNVLYTDTWLSMGDDTPLSTIKQTFMPYQINQQLLELTGASHVMHCQPAHRDLEITSNVMDSKHSLLLQQAENRMHAQNAILATLLG
ncbi:ornithine carbamoyltransferase [Alteromonas sp. a30]|uniref:ornithine carbamoyltransferase n=1 Tax=Alteromonas sp. a30 TaxID=2730917 RepID=UPI00227EA3A0|nr:ornithine carbamoyltransferase [Alteromonas sp. a30]MCY7295291.1 ornithine carbamoyltransferase [Alteromonas sp. a30]